MIRLPGSLAICAGVASNDTSAGIATDQRGDPAQPSGGYCPSGSVDSGAVPSNYALSFIANPNASQAIGVALTPSPVVALTESGSPATMATSTVVISDSKGLLAGANAVTLSGGSATFNNLTISGATSNDNLAATVSLNPNLSPQLNLLAQSSTNITTVSFASALTAPTPGATLAGSTVTFAWTTGTEVKQNSLHVGTTGAGSTNLFGRLVTGQSQTVTGIPITGATLYVRLYSLIAGAWQYIDYTYAEEAAPAPASITSPAPGSTLAGSTVTFSWTAGSQVTSYYLQVGTTGVGSTNLFNRTVTGQSQSVTGIPTTGGTVYVTLLSLINGAYQSIDYTYTEQ